MLDVFTLSKFLSNKHLPRKTFSNIFFLLGQVIFVNFLQPIYVLLLPTSFIYIKVSSLLLPLNDASGDIVDDESSFQFSSEVEFISSLYVHITLAADTEEGSLCFAQLLQC